MLNKDHRLGPLLDVSFKPLKYAGITFLTFYINFESLENGEC